MSIIEPATMQMIKNIIDGTTPPERAIADEDGKSFKDYYALKSELSSTVIETTITDLNSLPLESGIYKNESGFTTNIPDSSMLPNTINTINQEVYYYTNSYFLIIQTAATQGILFQRLGYGSGSTILSRGAWGKIVDSSGNTYATQAEKATKLANTTAIGSATKPVYINASGQPVAINYELGEACKKGISDSTSASNLSSTDTNVPTVRDIYYGMPTINGTKASIADIYAPISGGTSGNILTANGATSIPTWLYAFDAITSAQGGFTYSSGTAAYSSTSRHIIKIPFNANYDLGIEWQFTSAATTSGYHDQTITFTYTYAANPLVLTTYSETNDSQCSNMYGWIKQGSLGTSSVKIRTYKGSQIMFLVIGLVSK